MPRRERLRVRMWAFRIVCGIVLATGAIATVKTADEHWVERSGKVLVALALVLTYSQFRYEVEHASSIDTARHAAARMIEQKPFVTGGQDVDVLNRVESTARSRYDADRSYILLNALAAAAIGELVSAFGGLALELFS